MKIRPAAQNKPYYRRQFRQPMGDNPMGQLQMLPPGLLPAQTQPDSHQSVFQTNASHVLSPNTFVMADASTAPYPYDASLMRNAMSPHGKSFLL